MLKPLTLVMVALSALMTVPAESRERTGRAVRDVEQMIDLLPQRGRAIEQNLGLGRDPALNDPTLNDPAPVTRELALDRSQVAIAPSEAAAIARDMVPGSKVVGVRLLPSGYYAVTLRAGGSVTRVMVSAIDGSVR